MNGRAEYIIVDMVVFCGNGTPDEQQRSASYPPAASHPEDQSRCDAAESSEQGRNSTLSLKATITIAISKTQDGAAAPEA